MGINAASRQIASTPTVNKIRDFNSGILKQLANVLTMLRNMVWGRLNYFAGVLTAAAFFSAVSALTLSLKVTTTSQVPPLASIFLRAEALNACAITDNFLVTSPSPRIFTPAPGPLARPRLFKAAASTL